MASEYQRVDGSRVREMTCPNCDAVAVGQRGDHCPACGYVVTGEPGRGGLPGVNPGNAADEALQRCRAALSWLSPDNRQRAVSALVGDVIRSAIRRGAASRRAAGPHAPW